MLKYTSFTFTFLLILISTFKVQATVSYKNDFDKDIFPSLVRVFAFSNHCLGSVIEKKIVLTAAHCVFSKVLNRTENTYAIRIESPLVGHIRPNVQKVVVHPSYTNKNFTDEILFDDQGVTDIALIYFAEDLQVTPTQIYTHDVVVMDKVWVAQQDTSGSDKISFWNKRIESIEGQYLRLPRWTTHASAYNVHTGDSGGPAYYIDSNQKLWQVGINSQKWSTGRNQKLYSVDLTGQAVKTWLKARILKR